MVKRKVVLLSLPNGIFGNGGQSWKSINLAPTQKCLEAKGFVVETSVIDQISNLSLDPSDIVIYSSCESKEVREYMKDTFYFLQKKCILLPDYEFLLAYENKGFQEIKKRALNIGNLAGTYHFDLDANVDQTPFVFKTIDGAGSSGVHLVRSKSDRNMLRRKYFRISLWRKLALVQRYLSLKKSEFYAYKYRHKGFSRHISQEFVPNADHDYKVLVFGDRYFGLKRHVRQGDFRASGSGSFDFEARLPDRVLDFASEIASHLDAPQLSLDIVTSIEGCHLIEYQAMNFGPMALSNSFGYYKRTPDTSNWSWIAEPSDLSECFAYSLGHYFDKHGLLAN
jgi:hypothetical protein